MAASNLESSYVEEGSFATNLNESKEATNVYQEAAVYLEEGIDNDKFDTHPKTQEQYKAFRRCHNHVYYITEVLTPFCLMLLALVEEPAAIMGLPFGIYGIFEVLFMGVLITLMVIRGKWLGWKKLFRQRRTIVKTVLIIGLLIDAFVEMGTSAHHYRYLRALRPLLLFDAYYLAGLRRITRDIFYSLIPILDMLILVMFFLLIFSLFGFLLFSNIEGDQYFQTFKSSFVQMFVLLTTSNHPDVMTVEYDVKPWSALFFDIFLLIGLYLLLNLFLAVVYSTFGDHEKNKFMKLYLHKRAALMKAFNLIVKEKNGVMKYNQFKELMKYFKPRMNHVEIVCCCKVLDQDGTGSIQLSQFLDLFLFCDMRWVHMKKGREHGRWYDMPRCPVVLSKCGKVVGRVVEHKYFHFLVGFVLLLNLAALIFEASYTTDPTGQSARFDSVDDLFLALYCLELVLKMFGLGPQGYFRDVWNWFDMVIVIVSLVGQIADDNLTSFVFLRPLRLIRLFALRKRYRDVLFTLWVVMPRMSHMLMLLANIYYFFAIIGMEVFANRITKGIFNNETDSYLTTYYNGEKTGRYHDINFNNILRSYQTLFVLTVVNNWFIIMDAYALVCGELARAYFMIFYLVILVIVTIVVSFVLDAFLSIDSEQKQADESQKSVTSKKYNVTLNTEDLLRSPSSNPEDNLFTYVGKRRRTKDDLSLTLYKDDIPRWIEDYEAVIKSSGTVSISMSQMKRLSTAIKGEEERVGKNPDPDT